MYKEHTTQNECKESFLEQFEEGSKSERWMAIIFSADGDQLVCRKTTSKFLKEQFDHAVVALKKLLDKERVADEDWQPGEPLPKREKVYLNDIRRNGQEKNDDVETAQAPEMGETATGNGEDHSRPQDQETELGG